MKLKAGKFYGKTSRTFTGGGLRFTEKSYNTYAKLPVHAHELPHFCLVLAGNYNETIGSQNFERQPMALVYYPPDVSHSEEHFKNGRHFLVEFDFECLDRVRNYGATLDRPLFLNARPSLEIALRMYKEFSNRDDLSALALESIAMELLIATSRQKPGKSDQEPPKWLKRAKEYLDEYYREAPGLTELAAAVEVHPTHLARVFRKFEDCTAGDYLRNVRIRKARHELLSTKTPLVDIALDTGFSDQAHFSRSFKKATGMTPSKFRSTFA
ncbi:MAG: AraC family transcriptional regulator [Acidobacteriota bacterium]|nr:AraC family transcriptional regulator [Acidobacteriota bacterium]MDH3527935.1 AraC family transcriptional regulator [Acidobacteriota bacterium]